MPMQHSNMLLSEETKSVKIQRWTRPSVTMIIL
jgi:hypothetical protein